MECDCLSCAQQLFLVEFLAMFSHWKCIPSITRSVEVKTSDNNLPKFRAAFVGSAGHLLFRDFERGARTSQAGRAALRWAEGLLLHASRKEKKLAFFVVLSGLRRAKLSPLCNVPPPHREPPFQAIQSTFESPNFDLHVSLW